MLRQIATDALMLAYENTKNIRKLSDEMKAFKDERKEFKNEMKVFKDEMRDFKEEMRVFKDEINKKWGELANRLGTLTEDIFAPGIPYLVKNLGYRVKERMLDVEYKKNGMYNQYDAIVVAEDEAGNEVIFVAEVKSQLRADHFDDFRKKLENLVLYKPEYARKRSSRSLRPSRSPKI